MLYWTTVRSPVPIFIIKICFCSEKLPKPFTELTDSVNRTEVESHLFRKSWACKLAFSLPLKKMAHKSPVYSQIKGKVNILFLHSCFYLLCHLKIFVCLIKWFCCCCSVVRLCPTLCNSMEHSTSGSSVFHYLPEFPQIHVHWGSDAV